MSRGNVGEHRYGPFSLPAGDGLEGRLFPIGDERGQGHKLPGRRPHPQAGDVLLARPLRGQEFEPEVDSSSPGAGLADSDPADQGAKDVATSSIGTPISVAMARLGEIRDSGIPS